MILHDLVKNHWTPRDSRRGIAESVEKYRARKRENIRREFELGEIDRLYPQAMRDHEQWLRGERSGKLSNKGGQILHVVCEHYGLSKTEIMSQRKTANLVGPRMIVCHLAAKLTRLSHSAIARLVDRDHTTILHAIREMKLRRAADAQLDGVLTAIESRLKAMGIGVEE